MNYLKTRRLNHSDLTFLSLFIACYVRMLKEHPQINRFLVNRRLYSREDIHIAFVIKKQLIASADEAAIKLTFTGNETLEQIHNSVEARLTKIWPPILKRNRYIGKIF